MRTRLLTLFAAFVLLLSITHVFAEEVFDLSVFDADVEIIGGGWRLGTVLAAGDINGDGIDDIVAANEFGSVYVVYGAVDLGGVLSLDAGAADVTFQNLYVNNATYARPQACFGDINGDHIGDLIIVHSQASSPLAVYGDTALPSVIDVSNYPGAFWLPFPRGVSTAVSCDDFNGDGFDDPMMATYNSGPGDVQVFATSGAYLAGQSTTPWDTHLKVSNCGDVSSPSSCIADLNNDGLGDIVFSSIKYYGDSGGSYYPGGVWVVYGDTILPSWINLDSVSADLSVYGRRGTGLGYFGAGIGAGDFNGDGFNDLIVGAPLLYSYNTGAAFILYGDTAFPPVVDLQDTTADVNIYGLDEMLVGNVIVTVDFNADGRTDIFTSGGHKNVYPDGRAALIFGSEDLPSDLQLASGFEGVLVLGAQEGDRLGGDLAAGDFNGDGLSDLLIAAPGVLSAVRGKVYVLFGSTTINYGDANYDKAINVADAIFLLNYLFKSGPQPYPKLAGDPSCDGIVDVADVIFLLNYLFKGGSAPGCS